MQRRTLLATAALAGLLGSTGMAFAQANTLFLSNQLRPVEEATKVRQVILKGTPGLVIFAVEEPSPFEVRVDAETRAGRRAE